MTTRTWYHFLTQDDVLPKSAILDALADVGVSLHAFDPDAPPGPGVLFFDEITDRLCNFLRQASCSGLERGIAIALSHSILKNGGAWRLLQAGASDVFAWDHSTNPAQEVAARFERWESVDCLVRSSLVQNNLIGHSPAWIAVLRQVVEVARFTDASVLIWAKVAPERSWWRV